MKSIFNKNNCRIKVFLVLAILIFVYKQEHAQYCTPTSSCSFDYIEMFQTSGGITNIYNSSMCGDVVDGHSDYTTAVDPVSHIHGGTVNCTVRMDGALPRGVKIWVDWNQDGDFLDEGELVWESPDMVYALFYGSFTVPEIALSGVTRMRVMSKMMSVSFSSCEPSFFFGETEDYAFEVLNVDCETPSNVNIITTATAAAISWDDVGSPMATWIEYGPSGFSPGSGTVLSSASSPVIIDGLMPNTLYEFTIRHQCEEELFSYIMEVHSFSTSCLSPSVLSVTSETICVPGTIRISVEPSEHGIVKWYSDEYMTGFLYEGTEYETFVTDEAVLYYAVVEVGDMGGCYSPVETILPSVYPVPELTVVPAIQYGCEGDSVTFNATESSYSYLWSNGTTTPAMSTNLSGEYWLEVTDFNGCMNSATVEYIHNSEASVDGFDFFPYYFSDYKTVNFAPINPHSVLYYTWYFGDGYSSTDENAVHVYSDSGMYNVTLVVENECSADSVSLVIFVRPHNTSVTDTELNEKFVIYPNPSNGEDYVILEMNSDLISGVTVYDILGRQIYSEEIVLPRLLYQLDIVALSSGQYYIKVQTVNGLYAVKKLIVI